MTLDDPGPLAGVQVLELDSPLTAFAGRLLWELGADVLLVEPSTGSPTRELAGGAAFAHYHAGKRALALDPSSDQARLGELLDGADVVLEGTTPDSLRLLADQPVDDALVHVLLTPFGTTGPRAGWQASDLVVSASGGLVAQIGWPGAPPQPAPADQAWHLTSLNGAIGALLALRARESTGHGQRVEVAALECVAASLEAGAIAYIHADEVVGRGGSTHPIAPHRLFRTSDGWVAGGLGGNRRMWDGLVEWMDESGEAADLLTDEMRDPARLPEQREHVFTVIEAFTRKRVRNTLFHDAQRRRLPWAAVQGLDEVATSPQLAHRGALVPVSFDGHQGLDVMPPIRRRGAERRVPDLRRTDDLAGWSVERPVVRGDEPRAGGSLGDVFVLDLTWVLAGPYATRILADHGADIVKVESRHRPDPTRFSRFTHLSRGEFDPDTSGYFNNVNRNKRSILLNLRQRGGVDVLLRLAARADVLIENFSAGALDRMGLGADVLRAVNPQLIVVSMSGFGSTGPWRDYVSYADAVSALSGVTALALDGPHAAPVVHGLADIVAGNHAALATLAALADRRRTGLGSVVDLSELEAMAAQIGPGLLALTACGMQPTWPGGCAPLCAPEGVYRCMGPDRWVAVTVPDDMAWIALCAVIGRQDLGDVRRLRHATGRAEHATEIDAAITAWTAPRPAGDVAERLQAAGVPAAAVQDGRDLVEHDPQLRARGFYQLLEHPRAGTFLHEGIPIRLSMTPGGLRDPAPLLGADTDFVLHRLGGYTSAEIDELRASGTLE